MTTQHISLDSPITTKIAWANECWQHMRESLLRDEEVIRLSERLRAAIQASRSAMAGVGIASECRDCENSRGGSCCGLGLENYYSGNLLLINLILGAELPEDRADGKSCFFLGPEGCRIHARHVICINYLCEEVTSRFDSSRIAWLREKEGVEVETLFRLNERLHELMKGRRSALSQEDALNP